MAKQSGHTRAIGTVDDLNLYFDQEWGFLARMLPGVELQALPEGSCSLSSFWFIVFCFCSVGLV